MLFPRGRNRSGKAPNPVSGARVQMGRFTLEVGGGGMFSLRWKRQGQGQLKRGVPEARGTPRG